MLLALLALLNGAEGSTVVRAAQQPVQDAQQPLAQAQPQPYPVAAQQPVAAPYASPEPTTWQCLAVSAEGDYDPELVRWLSMAAGEELRPCDRAGPGYDR